ncbi:hypothetical protein ACJQWK_11836 [Exserohilum turcicum]|uniref:Tat pathway signal sequence n=1 Tax=Exserohilum turcicum (strain 28A) TaxID=671987 RepID=R0IMJ9_EXST2|nr:uncharacterized protein SETTUDRAFT_131590 [Exserohilum turcica Et28A]EOA86240.1 hypothetical protein SETTUDRAFT_131590 [Exserohilum turcica Et28A]
MEKYTDTSSHAPESDCEDASLITPPQYEREEKKRRQSYIYITLLNLFIFTISMLSLTCAVMSQRQAPSTSFAKFMDEHHAFSPATHKVEYTSTTFAFAQPMNSSKYVGTAESVDDAWREIAYVPDQMVSVADFPKLGKPADALQVTDPRTGETGYRVGVEVFHQLHCLNLLRMSTYPEYYGKQEWSQTNDKPENVRAHLDHCIEVLRVNLMCFSDVNVFTFHPRPGMGYWPDYNSKHVCRNFDTILHWAKDNAMPEADV